MSNSYFTVNDTGRNEIRMFLERYHKRPAIQRLEAWVIAAETNMANNSPDCASIEIPWFDAVSNHTEVLSLVDGALTAHQLED